MKGLFRALGALALVACTGCGGSSGKPEADWTPVLGATGSATPSADANAPTAAARTELEAAVSRAQARLQQAPAVIQLMNPMGGGAVDLPEAARRCAALLAECRADQKKLGEIADALADAAPDPSRAPVRDLLARQRAAAYRFREWALIELLRATETALKDLTSRGTPGTAELLFAAGQLDSLTYGREGAILLRRWLELAPAALRRAAEPGEGSAGVAGLLSDMRLMAYAWGPNQWSGREKEDVRAHVTGFHRALAALPSPEARLAAGVVARWWDTAEKTNGAWPDASTALELAKNIRALGQKLPAAAAGLEALALEVQYTVAK